MSLQGLQIDRKGEKMQNKPLKNPEEIAFAVRKF